MLTFISININIKILLFCIVCVRSGVWSQNCDWSSQWWTLLLRPDTTVCQLSRDLTSHQSEATGSQLSQSELELMLSLNESGHHCCRFSSKNSLLLSGDVKLWNFREISELCCKQQESLFDWISTWFVTSSLLILGLRINYYNAWKW